jgi:hypothetical protein
MPFRPEETINIWLMTARIVLRLAGQGAGGAEVDAGQAGGRVQGLPAGGGSGVTAVSLPRPEKVNMKGPNCMNWTKSAFRPVTNTRAL